MSPTSPETPLTSTESREQVVSGVMGSPPPQDSDFGLRGLGCQSDSRCRLDDGHEGRCRHPRGCKCRPCTGRRARRSGKRAQAAAFHAIEPGEAFDGSMRDEEGWLSPPWAPSVRFEVKSGRMVPAWIINALGQVRAAGARAALVVKPKGSTELWVVMRLADFRAQCEDLQRGER